LRINDGKVTLKSVRIQGYRSCRDTLLTPDPRLSALIGINGAGKTNLLSAIRLLALSARAPTTDSSDVSVAETVVTAWFRVDDVEIGYRVRMSMSISGKNTDEIVSSNEDWNLNALTGSRAWRSIPAYYLFDFRRGLRRSQKMTQEMERYERYERQLYAAKTNQKAIFRALPYFDDDVFTNSRVHECIQRVFEFCNDINYYSASQFTDPSRCPSGFEIDTEGRLTSGNSYSTSRAHVKFLHELYTLKKANPELYDRYIQFISKEELGLISRLTWKDVKLSSHVAEVKSGGRFKKVRNYKTLVIPKVQIGASHLTFNQLSEGTFKTLAVIFYIMTDASRCLLIEEPEVCVHHGLLNRIVSTIKAYSTTKQVIFSTHSDLVLDQLDPENVFVIEMKRAGTTATPMIGWVGGKGRVALDNYLAESGTLGEYWRSGGLA